MTQLLAILAHQLQSGDVVLGLVAALFVGWIACRLLLLFGPTRRWVHLRGFSHFASQIGTALGLEQAYELTRGQLPHRTDVALLNAYRLLDLEWRHGFFVESRIQRFFLQFQFLMHAIDAFYVLSHAIITIGVLGWIYARRRSHYPLVRNVFVLTTAIALLAFYLYPTAPPRMLAQYGFVDPLQTYNLVASGGAQPDSYTYNPYAAMPSLHVAYALIVSMALLLAEKRWLVRVAAIFYPLAMAAAVVISGNHWLLDVAAAALTVALSALILLTLSWARTVARTFLPRLGFHQLMGARSVDP